MSSIQTISEDVLSTLDGLLNQLSATDFSQPLPMLSGATLGKHVRHILECYQCLAASLADGQLNYDARPRDARLETDLVYARAVLQDLKTAFQSAPATRALRLRQEYTPGEPLLVDTNLGRELLYNIEHAIHHMALLRIGVLSACPEVRLPAHFGVAYATLRHQQATT